MKLLTRAEEYVLLAIYSLGEEAYTLPIQKVIADTAGAKWSLGAIYTPLERLEKRGYISSELSEAVPERGGRKKRIYTLTSDGLKALKHIYQVQRSFYAICPKLD